MAIVELNDKNFDQAVTEGIMIVDFWAPWCGPCRMLSPTIDEIANELPHIKVGKVNVDDNHELAMRFSVMSIPTVIIFKDGKIMETSVGVVAKNVLKAKIEAIL